MRGNSGFHCWRYSKRLMHAREVVIHEVERHHRAMVLQLFAEGIRQAGEPSSVTWSQWDSGTRGHVHDGHKTRAVFERYNIVSSGDLKEAARKLDLAAGQQTLRYTGWSLEKSRGPADPRSTQNPEQLAEGEGFEPPERLPVQWFSRPPPSTTRPSLRVGIWPEFGERRQPSFEFGLCVTACVANESARRCLSLHCTAPVTGASRLRTVAQGSFASLKFLKTQPTFGFCPASSKQAR